MGLASVAGWRVAEGHTARMQVSYKESVSSSASSAGDSTSKCLDGRSGLRPGQLG